MKRTRILSIVLITLLLTFLLSPNAPAEEKKSVAPSVLEKLNNQAYSTTYDILEKDGPLAVGSSGEAVTGLTELLAHLGLDIEPTNDLTEDVMASTNDLARLIVDPAEVELPVQTIGSTLFEEMLLYALYSKDVTEASFVMFGMDDLVDLMLYYSAAQYIIEGKPKAALPLYQQAQPFRNSVELMAEIQKAP